MALTKRHADILTYLNQPGITHVEAGSSATSPAIVPFPTLRALAARGLVTLSWMREDALYTSAKPYRIARITDAGRLAVEWIKEDESCTSRCCVSDR